MKQKTGNRLATPQWRIIDDLSSDSSEATRRVGADGVCVAVVMADLFTCSKDQHLTHICDAPVSAATRLL